VNSDARLLILSVDYEIFGNGSGDVRQHIIEPTYRMAEACQRHGVPLTVFFEAEEYVAFQKFSKELTRNLGYDPATLIRDQIRNLVRQGHDVQLHLHPEWHGADYRDGQWILRPDKKTVDSLFQTQAEVDEYIAERKGLIEEISAEAGSSRKVRTYRAGAFSAQPGQKLLAALAKNGFILESSVVKGLHSVAQGFDYRSAPSGQGPWRIKDDVAQEHPAGPLWEYPIYSVMGRRFNQLTISRLRAKFSKNVPKNKQKEMIAQLDLRTGNPVKVLQFLWQSIPIKLDFHNLSARQLLAWIRSAPKATQGHPDVLVLIGHTKEHLDDGCFERLLTGVAREPGMRIISFDDLARLLLDNSRNEICKEVAVATP
jgi:hypothetical protein